MTSRIANTARTDDVIAEIMGTDTTHLLKRESTTNPSGTVRLERWYCLCGRWERYADVPVEAGVHLRFVSHWEQHRTGQVVAETRTAQPPLGPPPAPQKSRSPATTAVEQFTQISQQRLPAPCADGHRP